MCVGIPLHRESRLIRQATPFAEFVSSLYTKFLYLGYISQIMNGPDCSAWLSPFYWRCLASMPSSAYSHPSAKAKMHRSSTCPSVPSSNVLPSLTTPTSCRSRRGVDIYGAHVDGEAPHLLPLASWSIVLPLISYQFLILFSLDCHIFYVGFCRTDKSVKSGLQNGRVNA
jgi:hypothetical protein